jgi:glucan biosynthesis protein
MGGESDSTMFNRSQKKKKKITRYDSNVCDLSSLQVEQGTGKEIWASWLVPVGKIFFRFLKWNK